MNYQNYWRHTANKSQVKNIVHKPYFEWKTIENIVSSINVLKRLWISSDRFNNKDVLHVWIHDPNLMYFVGEKASNIKWIDILNPEDFFSIMSESKDHVIVNHGISNSGEPAAAINTLFKFIKKWWELIIIDNYDWESPNSIFSHLKKFWYEINQVEDKIVMIIKK